MSITVLVDLINNLVSLVLLAFSFYSLIHIFLIDPLRRWRLSGYLPSVVIALIDPLTKEIAVFKYDPEIYPKKPQCWKLAQGGIYSPDILDTVDYTMQKEFHLDVSDYAVKNVKEVGKIKYKKLPIPEKKQYGILGFTTKVIGKGYLSCICICDSKRIRSKLDPGVGYVNAQFIAIEEFKKSMFEKNHPDPKKAEIYKTIVKYIEEYIESLKIIVEK